MPSLGKAPTPCGSPREVEPVPDKSPTTELPGPFRNGGFSQQNTRDSAHQNGDDHDHPGSVQHILSL